MTALRPAHWIKNLLLAAPMIFGHAELTAPLFARLSCAFLICCLAASAGYLVNDVLDRSSDTLHSSKRLRPIAVGLIDSRRAAGTAGVLALSALALAVILFDAYLAALVAVYLVLTVFYSSLLKRLPVVDVFVLAALFTWRLVVGGTVSDVQVSGWLLAFGYNLFLALALVKRLDEVAAAETGRVDAVPGRAYRRSDLGRLNLAAWLCAGVAVAILVGYVALNAAAEHLYRHEGWLWISTALLGLWLIHILRRARAGRLRGDPVVFAATDPVSLILAVMVCASLIAAV